MDLDYVKLGKRIREERRKRDLTQEDISNGVKLTPAYIGQIERGERKASLDTLVAICNYLDVTVDSLLHDSIDNESEYLKQRWIKLMNGRSDKEQESVINIVKSVLDGFDTLK